RWAEDAVSGQLHRAVPDTPNRLIGKAIAGALSRRSRHCRFSRPGPICAPRSRMNWRRIEVHAIVVDLAGAVGMKDRDARDGDMLAVLAVVGDAQLDDGVVADVPFLHDLVMLARDRAKERGYARADLLDSDQGFAVAENNSPILGEKGGYRRNIHRVDHCEEVARVRTRCGTHGDPSFPRVRVLLVRHNK